MSLCRRSFSVIAVRSYPGIVPKNKRRSPLAPGEPRGDPIAGLHLISPLPGEACATTRRLRTPLENKRREWGEAEGERGEGRGGKGRGVGEREIVRVSTALTPAMMRAARGRGMGGGSAAVLACGGVPGAAAADVQPCRSASVTAADEDAHGH